MAIRKAATIEHDDDDFPPGFTTPHEAAAAAGRFPMSVAGFGDDDDDDTVALTNVLNELGGSEGTGGFVTVMKDIPRPNGTVEKGHVGRFNAAEFSLDMLKEQFGAGRYNIRVYQEGVRGCKTNKTITILDTVKPQTVVAPVNNSNDIKELAAAMMLGFQKMNETILTVTKPAEDSEEKMLRRMALYKELLGGNPAPVAPQYNPIELMMKGMEMAQLAQGGGDGNAIWVKQAIETFGPLIASQFENRAAQPQPRPRVASSPASPALASPAPAPTTETTGDENEMMKLYVKMLETAAAKNDDPVEWANKILDLLPADQVSEVENILKGADWKIKVGNLTPFVNTHVEWFTALRDTLLDFIEQDRQLASGGLTSGLAGANLVSHETSQSAQPDAGKPSGSPDDPA